MQREIKFRAWHKGYPDSKHPPARIPQMFFDEFPGCCLLWKYQGQPLEVMQFTGLHDKNGKEIYEGDILRYSVVNCSWMKNQIGIVEWGKRKAGWLINERKYAIPFDCEVIGNIHQHGELLNGE